MALYYSLVFGILATEVVLFLLISLPLPSKYRRSLLKLLEIPFHSQHFQIGIKCVFGFILVLFIDSINRLNKINNELFEFTNGVVGGGPGGVVAGMIPGSSRAEIQSRRFYSQRNTYLCGFTLFLTLILNRTYGLVFELISVKEEIKKTEGKSKVDQLNLADPEEVASLKKQLADKDIEIETLKEKAQALSKDYDDVSSSSAPSQSIKSRSKKT